MAYDDGQTIFPQESGGLRPLVFPFLSLPLEIRNQIYEYVIFPSSSPEIFIFNPLINLSLLLVSCAISFEASCILYTRRTAVIAFLPHQFYLHGRKTPVSRLFRSDDPGVNNVEGQRGLKQALDSLTPGHIYPHILSRFCRIRLCLFFPATFQTAYPLMFFDPIAELKSVLQVLRGQLASSMDGRDSLEIIVAVYPRPENEEAETGREARVREDFVRRGVTGDLKAIRRRRRLKVGGNFTKEGLIRFCNVTCGD